MSAADIRAGRAYVELYLKNREFLRGLRNARERVRQFAVDLKATGQAMAALGGASLVGLGFAAKQFADFDDQMRAVKAVTQASQVEFDKLTKKAEDLGAATSYTAQQAAALMVELGRAGFKPDDIEAMTGAVLDLARATGTDATAAAGIMAASIRQFALAGGDATRVADSLTAAANGSFNTVEMLGEALSYAGPVASDFNMSIEETLAVLGALGNVGIQGSNAGTAVRRLLTLTGAEAEKLKSIFGVTFQDAAGNARPLIDVLDEVNSATANLGTAERAKKFNEAFGLLGITGASAIAKNAQGARDLLAAIQAAGGQANKTAQEMDAGLGGVLRITRSAIDAVVNSIGKALAPTLMGLGTLIQDVSKSTREWIEGNQRSVLLIAEIAAGVTIAGVAMLSLGTAILTVNAALSIMASLAGAVTAVLTLLVSPVRMLTIGFMAVRAVLISLTAVVATARAGLIAMLSVVVSIRTAVIAFRVTVLAAAASVFILRVSMAALIATATVTRGVYLITTAAIAAYRATVVAARTATITLVGASTALTVATKGAQVAAIALRTSTLALMAAQRGLIAVTGSLRVTFVLSQGAVIALMASMKTFGVVVAAARTFAISFRAALISLRAAFVGVSIGAMLAQASTIAFAAVGAVLTAITSPIAIVVAGLGALAYFAYQAVGGFDGLSRAVNGFASGAFANLSKAFTWFTSNIIPTFLTAFGGIQDAIMSGNWALAGQIAMAGLKVAFLQGTQALSDIFGDFAGKFGAQIAGGDFAGAWNTVILQMGATWAEFAEGMVAIFTQASRAVIDTWQSSVTSIANMMLDLSSSGGVAGSVMSKILGVDMSAEDAKAAALKIKAISDAQKAILKAEQDLAAAQRGEGTMGVEDAQRALKAQRDRLAAAKGMSNSATEDAKQIVEDSVAAQANAGRDWLSELDRDAQARTRAANQANNANTAGGGAANNIALNAAQAELQRLREEALKASKEAALESEKQKQDGRNGIAAAAGGMAGGLGSRVAGSFSAAALSAMGQGTSPMERTAKASEMIAKATERSAMEIKELRKINEDMRQELRIGGMIT